MIERNERRPHVERRGSNRVSSAVWPVKVRKVVATGKAAQRRRDWIIQGRWWVILADALTMRVLLIPTTLLVSTAFSVVAFCGAINSASVCSQPYANGGAFADSFHSGTGMEKFHRNSLS